jgi:hypothetical protein
LLVAPITEPADPVTRMGAVKVWLPPGTWTDVLTGRRYIGDRELVLHRTLAELPVLAAAGAVVPLDAAAIPADGVQHPSTLEVLVVPGADGEFELIEDDGTGDGLDEARVSRTVLRYRDDDRTLRVEPASRVGDWLPTTRTWTVTVVGPNPTSATVSDVPTDASVEIRLPAPDLTTDHPAELFEVLDRAYLEHDRKVDALRVATADQPSAVRLSGLLALDLPGTLLSALAEVLTGGTDPDEPASVIA